MTLNLKLISCSGVFRLVIIVILTFSFLSTFSQAHRISVSSSYNVPIGELSWTYDAGIGVKLNYSSVRQKRKVPSRVIGFYIAYTVLQPIADTLYYLVDKGGQASSGSGAGIGIAMYSPFKMFQLGGTLEWGIPLRDKISFTPGFSIGVIYGKREMTFKDEFGAEDGLDEFVTWATLIPEAGIAYKFSDHLSTKLFVAYNFIIQAGSTNPDAMDYNENTGMFYHYYSPGLSLNFSF